jgi:hypothetical protein
VTVVQWVPLRTECAMLELQWSLPPPPQWDLYRTKPTRYWSHLLGHEGPGTLLAVLRDFEAAYAAYDEFQRGMEHYWCLRWLLQEGVTTAPADVMREGLVRLADIPLVVRAADLPDLAPGTRVVVEIGAIDLVDSTVRCVYKKPQPIEEVA